MATAEATAQKVQRMLMSEFGDVRLRRNGGFAIDYGTTACFISVVEWGTDKEGNPQSLVQVQAPIGRDVRPTPDLYKWIVTEAQRVVFGRVDVLEQEDGKALLLFEHTILGDFLDSAELVAAVLAVTFTADRLDEVVTERFGGKRYVDQ